MQEEIFIEVNNGYLKLDGIRGIEKKYEEDLTTMNITIETSINTQASLILKGCFNGYINESEYFFLMIRDCKGIETYKIEVIKITQSEFSNKFKLRIIS